MYFWPWEFIEPKFSYPDCEAIGTGPGCRQAWRPSPVIRAWDQCFLQGIYTWDPATYVGTILVIVTVALTVCCLPARRAAQTDSMVALRYE